MIPTKKASSDMKRAANPRNETTRLSALATGLRLTTTAAPKINVISAKTQNKNGDIINCGLRIADCGIGNWQCRSLFLVPFQHDTVHYAADFEEFLLVMHHFRAREARNRIVFTEKDRLLGANLLTHPAENAADHVDIERFWKFLDFGEAICWGNFARNNFDRTRRTNEFAELTGHAAHPAILVLHERRRAAVVVRQAAIPFLLRILHGDLGASEQHVLEMLKRDSQARDDRGQIQSLAPV